MDPIDNFIPRDINNPGLEKLLTQFSQTIEECVNFGSNVIQWDLDQARGGDEQLPPIMMLRHFLDVIDSISILVRKSSIDPCKILLRAALEVLFNLEYLLKENFEQKSFAFLFWYHKRKKRFYHQLEPGSKTRQEMQTKVSKDKSLDDFQLPVIPDLDKAIKNLENLLNLPQYSRIKIEDQKLNRKKIINPNWFRYFNGPRNIEQLAINLKYTGLYEVLYRFWSGPVHGTDIIEGKILAKENSNETDIIQIRYFKDAQQVTRQSITIFILTIKTYIKYRIPERLDDYKEWYKSNRTSFTKINGPDQLIKKVD